MRLCEGPVHLAARHDIAPSTVHRILTTARFNRLSCLDRTVEWFAERSVTIERVPSDDGGAYRVRRPAALLTIDQRPRSAEPDARPASAIALLRGAATRVCSRRRDGSSRPAGAWRRPRRRRARSHADASAAPSPATSPTPVLRSSGDRKSVV